MPEINAAEALAGRVLATGWTVLERVPQRADATGGFFSICYRVEKDGKRCFLKAFNFAKFLTLASSASQAAPVIDVISQMLDAYKYERDLSNLCRENRVTKVVFVRDSGEEMIPGFAIGLVPYLIFDDADRDVRAHLSFSTKLEYSWKLKSLHSVAVGMKQLHAIDVSHQDLKPSNVLVFGEESKIGDLGRSTCMTLESPLRALPFSGDLNYAPPEVLYQGHATDWRQRSFASDTYLFGSLVVFYFSGLTMTALLRKHLPEDLSWERYRGSYPAVLPYVLHAHALALDDFASCLDDPFLRRELRSLVEALCHPEPEKRRLPGMAAGAVSLTFERVVSRLDYLYRQMKFAVGR